MPSSWILQSVPYQRLLHKLDYYGVHNSTLRWVIPPRKEQSVLLDGTKSSEADVLSGVPQFECLGLFYFWQSSMTCRNTQMPGFLPPTIAFYIGKSPQHRIRPSYNKTCQLWRDGRLPGRCSFIHRNVLS